MGARIGEKDAIGILRGAALPPSIGLYDDAYPIECCGGILLIKPDAVAESTDLLPGMGLEMLARKAALAAASDIAVKGGRPRWFTSAVMLPPAMATEENFSAIRDGFARASAEYGLELVAGDTGSAAELVIDVTAVGTARRFVGRIGGGEGDRVFAAGWGFGYTWLGYRVLLSGERPAVEESLIGEAIKHLYEPRIPMRFEERAAELVSAAMDSSDGLAATLYELADLNGLDLFMEGLPIDRGLEDALEAASLDPAEAALHGGEEYAAVGLVDGEKLEDLRGIAEEEGVPLWVIGVARKAAGSPRVVLEGRGEVRRMGWTHF
ncbi:MAG: thiamine-phosphate kinase [Nitrososphaeria archaeon]